MNTPETKIREEFKKLEKRVDEIEAIINQPKTLKIPPGWECGQAKEFRRIMAERKMAEPLDRKLRGIG